MELVLGKDKCKMGEIVAVVVCYYRILALAYSMEKKSATNMSYSEKSDSMRQLEGDADRILMKKAYVQKLYWVFVHTKDKEMGLASHFIVVLGVTKYLGRCSSQCRSAELSKKHVIRLNIESVTVTC